MTALDTGPNGGLLTDGTATAATPLKETPAEPAPQAPCSDSGGPRRRWRAGWGQRAQARRPGAGELTKQPEDRDDAIRMLALVRRARRCAVWLTVGIASVSFVLSFASLRELAAMSAWPGWPSWLWPLIIDGTIILATLGIVALAPYRDQRGNRRYFWLVLAVAALVSVGGNSLHAWLTTQDVVRWMRCGSAGLACLPPIALLASTHSLAILWRFNPAPPADASARMRASALVIAADSVDRWTAAAARIQEQGYCANQPTVKIAAVLRYLYDHRPRMSLRQIGGQPEVDLHHDTVGKIRDAAQAVLGLAAAGDR